MRKASLDAVCNIHHIQVIITSKCKLGRVRRIRKIDCTFRLHRKVCKFFRRLDPLSSCSCADIHGKGSTVRITSIVAEHRLRIAHPLPCTRQLIELLCRCCCRNNACNQYCDDFLHIHKPQEAAKQLAIKHLEAHACYINAAGMYPQSTEYQ